MATAARSGSRCETIARTPPVSDSSVTCKATSWHATTNNAQWCAALPIINKIAQFETTNGARLFPEVNDGRLLNRPLNELSTMDGVIDVGAENYCLLYGDFQQFIIVDRIGTTLEILPGYGANQRPTAHRHAIMTFRTGSDCAMITAFRVLNLT